MTSTYLSSDDERLADQRLTGGALREIRERKRPKLTQAAMGAAMGMSTQAWQKHEAGERRFDDEGKWSRILAALGVSDDDVEEEKSRQAGLPPTVVRSSGGFRDNATPFNRWDIPVWGTARAGVLGMEMAGSDTPVRTIDMAAVLGTDADALELAGDSMIPWAEPGEVIIFNRKRFPRRGFGCVVETNDGDLLVKLYEKTDGSTLYLRQLNPPEEVKLPLRDIKGVYAVRMRGD